MITLDEATKRVLKTLGKDPDAILGSIKKLSWYNLVYSLIEHATIDIAAKANNMSRNTLKTIISNNLDSGGMVSPALTWSKYLLSLIKYKSCTNCGEIKEFTHYYTSSKKLGVSSICKSCHYAKSVQYRDENRDAYLLYLEKYRLSHAEDYRARNAKYRASKIQRCPPWADLEKISEIYSLCPEGYHVDHIIPLNGKWVSGLHVPNNLQYLLARDNLAKSNKWGSD